MSEGPSPDDAQDQRQAQVAPPPYPVPYAGQVPPGQPGWVPPGQPGWVQRPGFPGYTLPDHPKATAALVIGIISVAGTFVCVLPVLVAPVAWVLGAMARNDIRRAPQQWGGDGRATAGMVLGIIGTVLLALILVALVVLVVLAVSDSGSSGSSTSV